MRTWVRSGILLVLGLVWGMPAFAAAHSVHICVQDERGGVIVGARVEVRGSSSSVVMSDPGGCVVVTGETHAMLEIGRGGFGNVVRELGDESQVMVVMRVSAAMQEVEVTAARAPLSLDASASSVRTMTGEQLREAPGFTLDDRLRQVAGFQLFRRASSCVANPGTE